MIVTCGGVSIPRNEEEIARFTPKTIGAMSLWIAADLLLTLNPATINFPQGFDNGAWARGGLRSVTAGVLDPLGGFNAQTIGEDGTNANHFVSQTMGAFATNKPTTLQVFAKSSNRLIAFGDDTGLHSSWFNLATGTALSQVGLTARSITPAGNGYFLLSVSSAGFDGAFTCFMSSADGTFSYQGDGSSTLSLFNAQVSQPKISSVADQSGSGNNPTQGTTNFQPALSTFNGKPCFLGDAIDDRFTLPGPTLAANNTFFAVLTPGSAASQYILANVGNFAGFISNFASGNFAWINDSGADIYTLSAAATGLHSVIVVQTGAASVVGFFDGTQVFNNVPAGGLAGLTEVRLLDAGTDVSFYGGSLCEFGIYPTAIDVNNDVPRLAAYLRSKWGTP